MSFESVQRTDATAVGRVVLNVDQDTAGLTARLSLANQGNYEEHFLQLYPLPATDSILDMLTGEPLWASKRALRGAIQQNVPVFSSFNGIAVPKGRGAKGLATTQEAYNVMDDDLIYMGTSSTEAGFRRVGQPNRGNVNPVCQIGGVTDIVINGPEDVHAGMMLMVSPPPPGATRRVKQLPGFQGVDASKLTAIVKPFDAQDAQPTAESIRRVLGLAKPVDFKTPTNALQTNELTNDLAEALRVYTMHAAVEAVLMYMSHYPVVGGPAVVPADVMTFFNVTPGAAVPTPVSLPAGGNNPLIGVPTDKAMMLMMLGATNGLAINEPNRKLTALRFSTGAMLLIELNVNLARIMERFAGVALAKAKAGQRCTIDTRC